MLSGQHNRNIDYNENMEMIIWNENNYVNVNQYFGEDTEVTVIPTYAADLRDQRVTVEIRMKSSYDYNRYVNAEEEIHRVMEFNRLLMNKLAEYIAN